MRKSSCRAKQVFEAIFNGQVGPFVRHGVNVTDFFSAPLPLLMLRQQVVPACGEQVPLHPCGVDDATPSMLPIFLC